MEPSSAASRHEPQHRMFGRVEAFVRDLSQIDSEEELGLALGEVTTDLGFRYFALTHHLDVRRTSKAIRLHNYPEGWEEWFDEQGLGPVDPVHRASHLTNVGFSWSELARLIPLTPLDERILDAARREGIGTGFTVPAHIPGEAHGSCSFATIAGEEAKGDHFPLLQLVGAFAFDAARRIRRMRETPPLLPRLTDRQRECVIWVARGKSDWEIARILEISEDTVGEHLRHARDRYGVGKRTLLAVHTLFDGTIGFLDVLKH